MKAIEYRVREVVEKKITWQEVNHYPWLKTIIVEDRKFKIEKWLFSKVVIDDFVDNKYYPDVDTANAACEKLNSRNEKI